MSDAAFLTLAEAVRRLDPSGKLASPNDLEAAIEDGLVRGVERDGRWLIATDELETLRPLSAVAEELGLDQQKLLKFTKDGSIESIQLGQLWVFPQDSIDEWRRRNPRR